MRYAHLNGDEATVQLDHHGSTRPQVVRADPSVNKLQTVAGYTVNKSAAAQSRG